MNVPASVPFLRGLEDSAISKRRLQVIRVAAQDKAAQLVLLSVVYNDKKI